MTPKPTGFDMRPPLLTSLALTLSASIGFAQAPTSSTVIGLDDTNRAVDGLILVADALGTTTLQRDGNGQADFVDTSPWGTTLVALGETPTPRGTALGMIHAFGVPGSIYANHDAFHSETVHQPLALPVSIKGSTTGESIITPSPYHSRWSVLVPYNSPLSFQAEIAVLHTPREINGFTAYNSAGIDTSNEQVGVVLRTGAINLGERGMVVRVDCNGHPFYSRPDVSYYHFSYDGSVIPDGSNANARVTYWDENQAYVFVGGALGSGDNVILLHPGRSDDATTVLGGSVPLRTVQSSKLDMGFPLSNDSAPGDCTPDAPAPPGDLEDCTPENPQGSIAWFFADCATTLIGSSCETKTFKNGTGSCGGVGGSTARQDTKKLSGSVSIGGNIQGVNVTATGSYEVGSIRTESHTYQNGAGCGQCWAPFVHVRLCVAQWQYWGHRYEMQWSFAEKCQIPRVVARCVIPTEKVETTCQGEIQHTSNTCDRTCD